MEVRWILFVFQTVILKKDSFKKKKKVKKDDFHP